ncbi:hypothetical protein SY88_07595 [Clostridiales bacterium PH28_bin88]|nr:hypothetical protein SY88_07595 [Clostridiales bacterium PH28_bin88]
MAVAIFNGIIRINQFRTNANMSQGKNVIDNWTLNGKTNIVIGQIAGNFNLFPAGANILNDPSVVDNPIFSPTTNPVLGPSIVEVV